MGATTQGWVGVEAAPRKGRGGARQRCKGQVGRWQRCSDDKHIWEWSVSSLECSDRIIIVYFMFSIDFLVLISFSSFFSVTLIHIFFIDETGRV